MWPGSIGDKRGHISPLDTPKTVDEALGLTDPDATFATPGILDGLDNDFGAKQGHESVSPRKNNIFSVVGSLGKKAVGGVIQEVSRYTGSWDHGVGNDRYPGHSL